MLVVTGQTEGSRVTSVVVSAQKKSSRVTSVVISGPAESSGMTSVVVSGPKRVFRDDLRGYIRINREFRDGLLGRVRAGRGFIDGLLGLDRANRKFRTSHCFFRRLYSGCQCHCCCLRGAGAVIAASGGAEKVSVAQKHRMSTASTGITADGGRTSRTSGLTRDHLSWVR